MTDREFVEELIKRLDLKPTDCLEPGRDEYYADARQVIIGPGRGSSSSVMEFSFLHTGQFLDHAVWS